MDWLIPTLIATLNAAIIVSLTFLYLFYRERERFLWFWFLSWSAYSCRFVIHLAILHHSMPPWMILGHHAASICSAIFFIWGTYQFLDKDFPRFWLYGAGLVAGWTLTANMAGFSFIAENIATSFFLGLIYIWSGFIFLRHHRIKGAGKQIFGWSLIIWGLHTADYPFLRPLPWFAPWGYLLVSVLFLTSAMGMILNYYERIRKRMENEIQERMLLEEALRQKADDRLQSLETLQKSESKYRALFENSADAMFILHDGYQVDCNNAAVEMLRYTDKAHILQTHPAELSPQRQPDGRLSYEKAEEMIATALAQGCHRFEWIHQRADGEDFPVEVLLTAIPDEGRKVLHVVWRDITARKQDEKLLAEQLTVLTLGAEVGAVLTSGGDLRQTLQDCCALLVKHLHAAFARIWLVNKENNLLELQASAGLYTRINGEHCHKALDGSSKIGSIAVNRKPLLTNAVIGDPLITDQEWAKREGMVSFAGHPLLINENVVGVMGLFSRHVLTDTVTRALASIADQIALGIDQAVMNMSLRERERKYRAIIDQTFQLFGFLTLDGAILDANTAALQLINARKEDVLGKPFWQTGWWAHSPELQEWLRQAVRRAAVGEDVLSQVTHPGSDGKLHFIDFMLKPIRNEQGEISFLMALGRDITEKIMAEQALCESERKLANLLANLSGMAYRSAYLASRTMQVVSEGCQILTGYTADELTDDRHVSYESLIHPDDRDPVWQQIRNAVEQHSPYHLNYRILTSQGQEKWVWEQGSAVADDDGQVIALEGFITDITDNKRAEKEKNEMADKLRQAQKMEALGTLAGGIAHDFNNILSSIFGYADLALMQIGEDSRIKNDLLMILSSAERAKRLVQQILLFSRQRQVEARPVQVNLIAKEVFKLIKASLPSTISINHNILSDSVIMADPTNIHQVMMNLCTNAFHAMEEHGGKLDIDLVDVELDENFSRLHPDIVPGPYVKLSVRDTGHGMQPETMKKIFDPYFTTKGEGKGTGIGLSVVHGIVKDCKGAITVRSEPGQGTTFDIFLPVSPADPVIQHDETASCPMGSESILFVDDEVTLLKVHKKMLEKLGYQVTTEKHSPEALALFMENPYHFDLIITDMTMPEMTGDVLAQQVLRIRPDIPVILCTGFSEVINEERAKQLGIRRFLMKPLVKQQLACAIRQVLDNKEQA